MSFDPPPDRQTPDLATAVHTVRVSSPTEERNPGTLDIDVIPTLDMLERINTEDATVAAAVRLALPGLSALVDVAVERIAAGGHIHYFGAGTSGRLGVLDAAELPPTYGVDPDLFTAHLAGGDAAIRQAQEGSEDDVGQGAKDAAAVRASDVVVGIASSGYTPYVGGALNAAHAAGAHTALITSNPYAPLSGQVDAFILVNTGPEVITGSTRMKSATAQKLLLNTFSTAVMIRSGRTWSNLMIDVVPTNAKLRGRVIRLLEQATGLPESRCEQALTACGHEAKIALLVLQSGAAPTQARDALTAAGGSMRGALAGLGGVPAID